MLTYVHRFLLHLLLLSRYRAKVGGLAVSLALAFLITAPVLTVAQDSDPPAGVEAESTQDDDEASSDEDLMDSFFATTTVTATGREESVFEISTPVTVLGIEEIERKMPENPVDLLRSQPGVDVDGVGPNQARPIIRGQRGLRVLFLENGLRLNNPRRQTDFGEISGLVSMDSVESVEVVRGPASVLYGTDAIGGVLNLVTRVPAYRDGGALQGGLGLRYISASDQLRFQSTLDGRGEKFSFNVGVSVREASDYDAPSGTFGLITLDNETRVTDTGVDDSNIFGFLGYRPSERHAFSLRLNRYRAEEAGFGFVEPELLGTMDDFRIRITYPFQDFDRFTLGYLGSVLESPLADSVDAQLYYQNNERRLVNDIDINIGPIFPGAPDSSVEADTSNFTDLETLGLRTEVIKGLGDNNLLTYGLEYFQDDSFNTDFSITTTTLRFPGPPFEIVDVSTDAIANAPNAENTSWGVFAQDEIFAGERLRVTLGARYQTVETTAKATPGIDITGLDFEDDAVVGAVNLVYGLNDNLRLVGSYGTAFRAPNIVERLFNGPTPEGAGFQILNPALTSEESSNYDIGLKYLRRNAIFEITYFQNDIDDGIIQHFLSDEEIAQLPQDVQDEILILGVDFVVQQQNIDRLRFEGIETVVGYRWENGVTIGGNYTHLDGERRDSLNPPTGDTFSDQYNAHIRYEPEAGRYWVEYRVRRNDDADVSLQEGEPVPLVGPVLPSFTVHTLSGGVVLAENGSQRHTLNVLVDNLTDELYSEFSNASFFRPQPQRSVAASYRFSF